MKKKLLTLFFIICFCRVSAQTIDIPDPMFEQALVDLKLDDVKDGKLLTENVKDIKLLHIDYRGISDLSGIEFFTNLEELSCSNNLLKSLDLSANFNLKKLNLSSNALTSIDVATNLHLKEFNVSHNTINSLDLINNAFLVKLNCGGNKLKALDIRMNAKLEELICYSNELINLDLSQNTQLEYLNCNNNKLTVLGTSNLSRLKDLILHTNKLTSLDLSSSTKLNSLVASINEIADINLTKNIALTRVEIGGNKLTELDVSNNLKLNTLWCGANQLTSLDVSSNEELSDLSCFNNYTMNQLILSSAITTLFAYNNKLTELDLSHVSNLRELVIFSNDITSLDLSQNVLLEKLLASRNKLRKVNFPQNTVLNEVELQNNDLGCVQLGSDSEVQNKNTDAGTWKIDSNVQFSTDCSGVTYQATAEASANGDVSFNKSPISIGETLEVTISPNEGYQIKEVYINEIAKENIERHTLENIISDIQVRVVYELKTYSLSTDYTENGVVSFDKENVQHGESAALSIVPNVGYGIKSVFKNEVSIGNNTQYSFESIDADINVRVAFELKTYKISATSDSNGKVKVNNPNPSHFEDVKVEIIPNENYKVKQVYINEEPKSLFSDFTLFRVDSHKKINVIFELKSYALTTISNSNGVVTFDKQSVNHGENVNITIVPEAGFEVSELFINNKNLGKKERHELVNVTEDISVSVVYDLKIAEPEEFNVNISPSVFGSLSVDKLTVEKGEKITFTFVPDEGFRIKEFRVNGEVTIVENNSLVIETVAEDLTAEVIFEEIPAIVLGIENNKFSFGPNPVNSVLKISKIPTGLNVRILNTQGKLVQELTSNGKGLSLNFENQPNGLYYLFIEGFQTRKIIKN